MFYVTWPFELRILLKSQVSNPVGRINTITRLFPKPNLLIKNLSWNNVFYCRRVYRPSNGHDRLCCRREQDAGQGRARLLQGGLNVFIASSCQTPLQTVREAIKRTSSRIPPGSAIKFSWPVAPEGAEMALKWLEGWQERSKKNSESSLCLCTPATLTERWTLQPVKARLTPTLPGRR